jgi:uncharacterized membrane protein YkgB
MQLIEKAFLLMSRLHCVGVGITRLGLIVVLLWIGGLKVVKYEAEGIVPFVANSPTMNFFYTYGAPEYKKHMNREGELVPANQAWHESNNTYVFAYGLGALIVAYGLLLCFHPWLPQLAAVGSLLVFLMSLVTLSFLVTTPETWVPSLGGPNHGFPYLSGAGRLVIKDAIMMGAALVTMADSANAYLSKRNGIAKRTSRSECTEADAPLLSRTEYSRT